MCYAILNYTDKLLVHHPLEDWVKINAAGADGGVRTG